MTKRDKRENLRPPWTKGVSGNPSGRPKKTPYTDAHREVAELLVKELKVSKSDSVARVVAKAIAKQAVKGKLAFAKEIADRVEGTPRQRVEVTGENGDPIKFHSTDIDGKIAELLERIQSRKRDTTGKS